MRWKGDNSGLENVSISNQPATADGNLLIFPNVGAMVASTNADIVVGVNLRTQGYFSTGGAGSATYVVSASATPDEKGAAFTLSGGLFAVLEASDTVSSAQFGAIDDEFTDNSANVQAAIDSFPLDVGGVCINSPGARFDIKSLTFPKRSSIKYLGQDERSLQTGAKPLTSELITVTANANNAGIVNEARLMAPFHPGHVVDVRKDITGHNAFLGAGQTMNNPARASENIFDEGLDLHRKVYESYTERSSFSGVSQHNWMQRYRLGGISTSSFAVTPVQGDRMTGLTSGAVGLVFSIDGTLTILIWKEGVFTTGESVVNNRGTLAVPINEVSSDTVTSGEFTNETSTPLTCDYLYGQWGVGLPAELAVKPLTVGGSIAIQATRTFGQYIPVTYAEPVFTMVDSFENTTPVGRDIVLDTGKNRLVLKKFNETEQTAHVGAVGAHTNFNDGLLTAGTSFNVPSSVTKNATGDYSIFFTVPFDNADYTINFGAGDRRDNPSVFVQTTTELRIRNYDNQSDILTNARGQIHVICVGGDKLT